MVRFSRLVVAIAIAAAMVGAGAVPAPVSATADYPYFACAIGSGHLTSPNASQSVTQGTTAAFTIDIERIGCAEAITFSTENDYLPPGGTATFSENPTTADSVTLTITTSRTWPTITPVGLYGAHIRLETGHNYPDIYFAVELEVTASDAPIATTPTSSLALGTISSTAAAVKTSWSAIDPDGIKAYTVQRQVNGGAWTTVALSSPTSTSVTSSLTFNAMYRYRVRATDRLGHTGAFTYGRSLKLKLIQQTTSAVVSDWHWTTQTTSSASGGSLKYQPYSGSEFTYTYNAAGVAWVSVTGPTRSNSLEILIDGVKVKSNYSLKATSTNYRRVVLAKTYTANAKRVLHVFNLGQIGHSRIDIDGFVLLTLY